LCDVLWFRLRVENREVSHPCRWTGSVSDPIVSCIAPVAAPPMVMRLYDDSSWHIEVSFFMHASSRPIHAQSVSEARRSMATDSTFDRFNDLSEDPPPFEEFKDFADHPEGLEIPVGYGHRQVKFVQGRVHLVGANTPGGDLGTFRSMPRGWIELPEISINHCKAAAPAALKGAIAERVGDLHSMKIVGTEHLREGGVYQLQIRVGDGCRWSTWSSSSRRFTYGVPQPVPPETSDGLRVETLSASVVRFSFPVFTVPQSIGDVEYLLHAEPTWATGTAHGVRPVSEAYVMPIENPDDMVELELHNLLPATEYVFSVTARYPRIGWRQWSRPLSTEPQNLKDHVADWTQPQSPIALPYNGPRPFALSDGVPFFHPNERALLLGFPQTSPPSDGIAYQLEYKHIGFLQTCVGDPKSADYRTYWKLPLEVGLVDGLDKPSLLMLGALSAPWKLPPKLWRVRLSAMPMLQADGSDDIFIAQLQRIQLRLSSKSRGDCPATRWFSAASLPICSAIAAPISMQASVQISDSHLSILVSFALDHRLGPAAFSDVEPDVAQHASSRLEAYDNEEVHDSRAELSVPSELPRGFCHAFATRFQVRSRHSPRPPGGQPVEQGRKPQGVPWSAWTESADADLRTTTTLAQDPHIVRHSSHLLLPTGITLEHGSWYQISVRISDGTCWSDWSEPSAAVKVFVAPPKPERTDTDELAIDRSSGGNNVKIRWAPLRAHGGLRFVEYALFVREVLHDRSEMCPRYISALISGHAARTDTEEETMQKREMMVHELRDLRQDITYIFTLAARYPHIGPREFEDVLNSTPTSLRPVCSPMPVPCQLPLPPERLRRMQGLRCVLLKWSFQGVPQQEMPKDGDPDAHAEKVERQYDLQALPEGAKDNEWMLCKNVARIKMDGAVAWFVKDVPGQALRSRFRLWERDTGRLGRTSPLMLTLIEPVQKVGALCMISESAVQIVLRAPLDARHGSHEYVCRHQVRVKPEQIGGEWTELPIQMLWHRQNDHLKNLDASVDGQGAVISGLPTTSNTKAVGITSSVPGSGEYAVDEGTVMRTPQLPTIPLATVGPVGDVTRQRCIVATIREEDGLQQDQTYTFSVRVGDLYRLSEWSEPSVAVSLAVPPPVLDPCLSADVACIRVSDITDGSLTATWPQFIPASQGGVPLQVEIEYLLTVAPQAPKRRLAGRGARQEAPPQPHSQWLLSSSAAPGIDPESVRGQTLNVAVIGLVPHTTYELKLSVRYARIGLRKWSEALSVIAITKKPDAEAQRRALENAGLVLGSPSEDRSVLRKLLPVQLEASKLENRSYLKESPRMGPTTDSPSIQCSPQALPPIGALPAHTAETKLSNLDPSVPHPDVEEWMDVTQADAYRITGGVAVTASAPRGEEPEYSARPADFVPFWRRDPMDGRPSMPQMPVSGHSAMQLDLVGRAAQFPEAGFPIATSPMVPRPPNSDKVSGRVQRPFDVDRAAYPRRHIHE
jgi:hypothetical protein